MFKNVKLPRRLFVFVLLAVFVCVAAACTIDEPVLVNDANASGSSENVSANEQQHDSGSEQGSENSESDQAAEHEMEPEQEQQAEQEAESQQFKVGDTVQLGDHQLTVSKVEMSAGSNFDQPRDGSEYVVVTVEIGNIGDSNVSYNPFDFKMSNSQGQIDTMAFSIIDSDTSLSSGELAPGGSVSGTIVFEQPKDDPELKLIFEPSIWSSSSVTINLNE